MFLFNQRPADEIQHEELYELAILKEIQDTIGYELSLEKIIDTICTSLSKVFLFTACSSLVIHKDKLIYKIHTEEVVSEEYITTIKQAMYASLAKLTKDPMPRLAEEIRTGTQGEDGLKHCGAFFHVPLVVNQRLVGVLTISSKTPHIYTEKQMLFIYKMANQALLALTRLETVLETEKGKLEALITNLADGVFMVDAHNNMLVINNTAKKLLSLTGEVTIQSVITAFPKDFSLITMINDAVTNKQQLETKEITLGENVVQVMFTPVFTKNADNALLGISVLLHDITLEKSLNKMKEDFVNMVVHDLRAPLTAIKGAATLMLAPDKDPKGDIKLLTLIHGQAQELLDQVTMLLDAAKHHESKVIVKKAESDVNALITQKVQVFMTQAMTKQISLTTSLDPKVPRLQFDSSLIGQVVANLISNSLKFTPDHGKIAVRTLLQDKMVLISVSDTGIGVPKDKQEKLFSKFYRANNAANIQGTGLGLYIVKNIIESHGGTVKLDSEPGRGTTVSFTLPVTA